MLVPFSDGLPTVVIVIHYELGQPIDVCFCTDCSSCFLGLETTKKKTCATPRDFSLADIYPLQLGLISYIIRVCSKQ